MGWRDSCVAKNASCKDCKQIGHFVGTRACKSRRVSCIKVESLNSLTPSNEVNFNILGPDGAVEVKAEADTGATITVFKAEMYGEFTWMDLEQSNVHIRGYDGNSKPCCGKARAVFQRNTRRHEEEVFFSNEATANYLSRGACLALGIIPKLCHM